MPEILLIEPIYYDLIVVGRGTAAAAFANTVDLTAMIGDNVVNPRILVIGEPDTWLSGKRGGTPNAPNAPNNKINQPDHMIGQYSDKVPAFMKGGWAVMVDRKNYAQLNAKILERFGTVVDASVKMVRKSTPKYYCVETSIGNYFGERLVLATGAGPHRVPEFLEKSVNGNPDLIMDMDAFSRNAIALKENYAKKGKKAKVFIVGPNAAIDVVELAAFHGLEIVWLVESNPAILDTHHQTAALALKGKIIKYNKNNITVKVVKNHIGTGQIQCIAGNQPIWGDFLVYGLGQDEIEATKFIHQEIKKDLEPVFDVNQRFGNAFESVLGFCIKKPNEKADKTEVLIIGALAAQVSSFIPIAKAKESYLARLAALIEKVQEFILTADLIDPTHQKINFLFQKPMTEIKDIPPDVIKAEVIRISYYFVKLKNYENTKLTAQRVIALGNLLINFANASQLFDKFEREAKSTNRPMAKFWAKLLDKPSTTLTSSTVSSPQIGSIIAASAANNGYEPSYLGRKGQGDVSYNQDDRTMLRVYIAIHFPFVDDTDASSLISEVMSQRKTANNNWGFSDQDAQQFKNRLTTLNAAGLRRIGML